MPTISITISTNQATRAQAAIGAVLNPDGSPATAAQATEWLLRQLKGQVRQYEQRKAVTKADSDVEAALKTEGW